MADRPIAAAWPASIDVSLTVVYTNTTVWFMLGKGVIVGVVEGVAVSVDVRVGWGDILGKDEALDEEVACGDTLADVEGVGDTLADGEGLGDTLDDGEGLGDTLADAEGLGVVVACDDTLADAEGLDVAIGENVDVDVDAGPIWQ